MFRVRPIPACLRLIPIIVLLLTMTGIAQAQVCHDGLWPNGEFCGRDAYTVTGQVDMNHDCVVDFLDVGIFWTYVGMFGPNLSADINADAVVNLVDLSLLAQSLASGAAVTPCNPSPLNPDFCDATLSLSLDPNIIVSRGRAAGPTPVEVHVVVDGWVDAAAIEFGIEHSPNLFPSNSASPIGWTNGMSFSTGNATYYSWTGIPVTGLTTVVTFTFIILDSSPAWVELIEYDPALGLLNRWAPSTFNSRSEFRVRRHVGINLIDTISETICPSPNVSPSLAIADPATDIVVPFATSIYNVTGTALDTDGTLDFVEYRINAGSWILATGTTNWSFNAPLIVGENWIQVRTADTVGAYSQTQVVTITREEAVDLTITAWSAPASLDHGCLSADFSVTVQNISALVSPASRVGFYLSDDAVIDATDYFLGQEPVPSLAASATHDIVTAFTVPDDGPRGDVYLGGFVDDQQLILEGDETNNTASSALDYPAPGLVSVVDVANDQGRQVRLNLPASSRDALGAAAPILQYEAFRKIVPLTKGANTGPAVEVRGTQVSARLKLAGWEFVGAIPAHGEAEYNMIVPTLIDASGPGIDDSEFFVRAATDQPLVYFDSCSMLGYSEDNLPPSVPSGIVVAYAATGNQLDWDPSEDADFRYFRIYRGSAPGFTPGPGNLVQTTIDVDWLDSVADPWSHYYQVSAVDFAGNESPTGEPGSVSGARDLPGVPTQAALHQSVPNPFNPVTRIAFDLPAPAFVKLDVYATDGRLVATLVRESMPPGTHQADWDGKDRLGRQVAAGVYFYRLDAGAFTATKRMVLVK